MKIYISKPSIICAAGRNSELLSACENAKSFLKKSEFFNNEFMVGKIDFNLAEIPSNFNQSMQTRTNQIALSAILEIKDEISQAINQFGNDQIAVVLGTTTSGVEENFIKFSNGNFSKDDVIPERNALFNPAVFVRDLLNLKNIAYSVSTACTSGLKAIYEGANLIKSGICKAAIVGGVDSLNNLTLFGFKSLSILSDNICNPFSKNRDGTNLGEGAAFMLLSSEQISPFILKSFESNCDAFHITTPRDDGFFQVELIKKALKKANLPGVDYINLHATGTIANDKMESSAINLTLPTTPSSGIKHLIGHTLGAAGAIEIAVCLEYLKKERFLPFHKIDEIDENLPTFNLLCKPTKKKIDNAMSLSFAFGGDNAAMIVGVDNV